MSSRNWMGGMPSTASGITSAAAGNPANWRVDQQGTPGDFPRMETGTPTMDISGNDLAGDVLVISNSVYTNDFENIALSNDAAVSIDEEANAGMVGITVNGTDTLNLVGKQGTADDTHITLAPGATLTGNFKISGDSALQIEGGSGATPQVSPHFDWVGNTATLQRLAAR